MFKKNKSFKTSKPIASDPIHINNKTFIPIGFIDVTILDIKYPTVYGTVDSKGIVVIDDDKHEFLPIDENFDLNDNLEDLPELKKIIGSVKNN